MLWSRRAELAEEINSLHTNSAYLGATVLPDALQASNDLHTALAQADVVAMAVPSQGFRDVANEVSKYVRAGVPVVSLSKGLEQGTFLRMSEVLQQIMPNNPVAVLSGPNLAKEILAGQPAASVIACTDESVARELVEVIGRPAFRLYTNPDVVGCEIGGVVKNVVACVGHFAGFRVWRKLQSNVGNTWSCRNVAPWCCTWCTIGNVFRPCWHGRRDGYVCVHAESQHPSWCSLG